jgi:uncharacterized membrane protein
VHKPPKSSAGELDDRSHRIRKQNPNEAALASENQPRNASMDSLRGLAIVLMVVDHGAGLLLDHSISNSSLRIAMRLSMPLFCLLMGYFLRPNSRFRVRRWAEIAITAGLVNLVFHPTYGCFEILASLLVAGLLGSFCGVFFPLLVLATLAYPIDPTDGWPSGGPLDFPLSLVVGFVALGSLHARYGAKPAWIAATAITAFYPLAASLTPGSVSPLLLLFVLPAALLVSAAQRWPSLAVPGLTWLGQNPLKAYASQYYLIFAIAYWWN